MTDTKETTKNTNKKILLGVGALAVMAFILLAVFLIFREKPVEGSKDVTIEVVGKSQESTAYEVRTDAEYLRQAMEEAEGLSFSGEEGQFGMMVSTVNGETADYSVDASYWAFYVNGEYCNYGIDSQPVVDGDCFSIVYTVDATE